MTRLRFWDAMDAIGADQLAEIDRRIVAKMVEVFEVDLSGKSAFSVVAAAGGVATIEPHGLL